MFIRTVALIGLLAAAAGCGVGSEATVEEGVDAVSVVEEDLGTTSQSYVRVRVDPRRCMAPMCGGYWVSDVNRVTLSERYVSHLDFSVSGLSEDDADRVRSAPAGELLLRGRLGAPDATYSTRAFLVTEAYRGMPGVVPAAGEAFYRAGPRTPQINCFAAPCDNEVATKLNYTAKTNFTGYQVDRAAVPFADKTWLIGRIAAHGALVSGKFVSGQLFPGGREKLLSASQVFLRIPDRVGPCPMPPIYLCSAGKEQTYNHTADRCDLPAQCAAPGTCSSFVPICAQDYSRYSWRQGDSACFAHACYPAFTSP